MSTVNSNKIELVQNGALDTEHLKNFYVDVYAHLAARVPLLENPHNLIEDALTSGVLMAQLESVLWNMTEPEGFFDPIFQRDEAQLVHDFLWSK